MRPLLAMVVCTRALLRSSTRMSLTTAPQKTFERTKEAIPDGVCCVYKPPGWTSSNVVSKIRGTLERAIRIKGQKRTKVKVGHGGTLDPNARGCLVIGVGTGCRMMQSYLKGGKEYVAVGKLGEATDTLDSEGNVTATQPFDDSTLQRMEALLPQFTGDIMQVPPMYSALHKDGKRLYELARQGVEVEREARQVSVNRLSLVNDRGVGSHEAPLSLPFFGLDVECSGGTYIRTLIDDLAREAGSCGHMVELERTRQGPFALEDCLSSESWGDFDAVCAHVEASRAIVGDGSDARGRYSPRGFLGRWKSAEPMGVRHLQLNARCSV